MLPFSAVKFHASKTGRRVAEKSCCAPPAFFVGEKAERLGSNLFSHAASAGEIILKMRRKELCL